MSTGRVRHANGGSAGTISVIVALVAVLLSGCEPAGGAPWSAGTTSTPLADAPPVSGSPPESPPPPRDGAAEIGCAEANGRAANLLPVDTADVQTVLSNPCVPLAELVDIVLGLVEVDEQEPATAQAIKQHKKVFSQQLGDLTGRLMTANEVAKCAYETDRLAIAIYQQPKYLWSVGVAAVIRGDVGAAVDVAACYLVGQVQIEPYSDRARPPGPQLTICGAVARSTRDGDTYTILTAGDTDQMCHFLDRAV